MKKRALLFRFPGYSHYALISSKTSLKYNIMSYVIIYIHTDSLNIITSANF